MGHKEDGTSVSQTFVTDAVIDGPGGAVDFETFEFSEAFQNLVRLEVTSDSLSMDNLVLELDPEPTGRLVLRSTGSTDTVGNLYWPSLRILASSDNGGAGSNFAFYRNISPGTYYLRVSEYGDNEPGEYSLSLGYMGFDDLPPAPTILGASQDQDQYVRVRWTSVPEANKYDVYRHTANSTAAATKIADNFAILATVLQRYHGRSWGELLLLGGIGQCSG